MLLVNHFIANTVFMYLTYYCEYGESNAVFLKTFS